MDKGEPALAPQWLRSTGSGNSTHHFASSSHSDVPSLAHHSRSRNSKSINDFDSPRSPFLDRTSSSNARRSSSNGKHVYSSFTKGHRDRDRDRGDRDRFSKGLDNWDSDGSDAVASILTNKGEKDMLRRSQSMVSRKTNELGSRRVAADLKNGSSSNHINGNGLISVSSFGSGFPKAVFDKDFPSLGSEERQGVPDIARVSSPGLSTAAQSLPVGSSPFISAEGWTSALAEKPTVIGSSSSSSLNGAQTISASSSPSASGASTVMAGLNMAEALTQAPSRTQTAPQLSVQTQRLEELAIKQSRQLRPLTPSMPKSSVLSSSDKSKPKTTVRSGEMNVTAKGMQQQASPMHPVNQSVAGVAVKSEVTKMSGKQLVVLKPGWENGVSHSPKDVASPTNNASRAANSQLVASAVPSAPLRNSNNPKPSSMERKLANLNMIPGFGVEKRPSASQTQSRNDFFNHLKKKTFANTSSVLPDSAFPSPSPSSPTSEKSSVVNKEVASPLASPQSNENGAELTSNGGTFSEEEAAFLRSLGWEENSGEDEGLTEEEISAFYQEYLKLKPSLKMCRGMQQKLVQSNATMMCGASPELSPSDSGSEA